MTLSSTRTSSRAPATNLVGVEAGGHVGEELETGPDARSIDVATSSSRLFISGPAATRDKPQHTTVDRPGVQPAPPP
ncbi:hypothetical protein [Nocardia sp. NPDC057440]|uniref:hypothetical protein n=1 Tax=Nocardia sp. NPDC057440 TaxID=3346134 RepID=UPI00366F043A